MVQQGESAQVSWPCRSLDALAWAWFQACDSFCFFFLFQAPDSSHWRFTRENQNMATERRLDNPVSSRGGILSCHSERRADGITSNTFYTCMLWPMGRQATSKTRARDHAWGNIRVARASPGSAQLFAPLECENFRSLDTVEEENKVVLRRSIIWDQTTDRSVLENQFLLILFAFGHLPRAL